MKNLQSNYLKLLLIMIPSILAVIFIVMFIKINDEFSQAINKYESKVEKLKKEKDELFAKVRKKDKLFQSNKNNIALDNYYINKMEEKGLTNPVQDIISDLQKHTELIPYKAVLGGRTGFYDKTKIWVLTNEWVLAYFEDGHFGGYLLLKYLVNKNGEITWQRISAMKN